VARERKERKEEERSRRLCDSDVLGHVLDTASVLAEDHADITLLTPARAPRVADDPVVGRAGLAPAKDDDGVVGGDRAVGAVHDTALVGLHLVGIEDADDGTVVVDGSLHGIDGLGDRAKGDNLRLDLLGVELALANTGSVRVGRVEHETLLGILSSLERPATRAAVSGSAAIDELLLREHGRSALVLLGIVDVHDTSDREGPAGAAGLLVADSGDPLLVAGIEGGGKSSDLLSSGLRRSLGGLGGREVHHELLGEAVGDNSHTVLSILGVGVELGSTTHVLVEHLVAALLLSLMLVGLAEGGLVGLPERILLEGHGAGSSSDKGKCIDSLHVRCM